MAEMTEKTRHILISQIKNIGDVVLTLPMVSLIRQYYPNAIISFLGTRYTQSVILGCSDIQHALDWDVLKSYSDDNIIQQWKEAQFSTIIHVSHDIRIARLAKKAHIPCRIGTFQKWFHWLYCNFWINQARRHSSLHEVELNVRMLKPLNINASLNLSELNQRMSLKPHTPLPSAMKALLTKDRFNLILHPGSNGHGREWPSDFFKQLIDQLPVDKFRIFLTGSPQEQHRFQALINESPKAIDLMGKMTLDEFITFMSYADGLVASGTGPLHLSAALGIKTLGLFPPRQGISPRRWAPVGKQTSFLVYKRPAFQACFLCQNSVGCFCMTQINVKQVFDVIQSWQK